MVGVYGHFSAEPFASLRGLCGKKLSEDDKMDTTLAEGWVRGQWALLHSLTVSVSTTGAVGHSSRASTAVQGKWITYHMDCS